MEWPIRMSAGTRYIVQCHSACPTGAKTWVQLAPPHTYAQCQQQLLRFVGLDIVWEWYDLLGNDTANH